jgi:Zn-dependent protease with chaperone function
MDFFEAQEQSRRQTRNLILLYFLATVAVAAAVTAVIAAAWFSATMSTVTVTSGWLQARWDTLALIGLGTLGFVGVASLFRIVSLSGGGNRVARELGATPVPPDTRDPLRQRLRNVVEEMAIASGVPVPDIYVLEQEPGINAFAAGFRPEDAVVAVTRGTLEQLDRDELQGVIGHEFSHILNGDMRLNIRLMGPLFGIMALGLLGRVVLRNLRFRRMGSSGGRSGNAGGALVIVALGLVVIGYIGVALGRLIKAGVSRQREYLADASAVQFTRQTEGIAGALKKIGGLVDQSYLARADAEEVSHMLFANGSTALTHLFATHPPLLDRIRKLDPHFEPGQPLPSPALPGATPERTAGFVGPSPDATFALAPGSVADRVGQPTGQHIIAARGLRVSLPERLYRAAHDSDDCLLLALALVLHPEAGLRDAQLRYVGQQFGAARMSTVSALFAQAAKLGEQFRLPLLDLAFPAIKQRPERQLDYLRTAIRQLVHQDQRVELFEYALARTLDIAIENARLPGAATRPLRRHLSAGRVGPAITTAFAMLAGHGHDDADQARAALKAGLARVSSKLDAAGISDPLAAAHAPGWQNELDNALDILSRLAPRHKRTVVAGLAATAAHDGSVTVTESELLRVMCGVLGCPLPPLYA